MRIFLALRVLVTALVNCHGTERGNLLDLPSAYGPWAPATCRLLVWVHGIGHIALVNTCCIPRMRDSCYSL